MLSLTAKTQIDKARHALRDAVAYADEVVRDERLRADIRAAVGHGTKASDRLRKEIDAGGISARLTSDAKLRKNLRAMLDDLDSAGQRMRRESPALCTGLALSPALFVPVDKSAVRKPRYGHGICPRFSPPIHALHYPQSANKQGG